MTDNNLNNTDNWFAPEFANALTSGAATSGAVTPGTPNGTGADTGLYVRTFQNCTVKVNFSTTATVNGLAPLTATIN
jgi:hypothetical protein